MLLQLVGGDKSRASIFLMHSFKTNLLFDFHILMTCKE